MLPSTLKIAGGVGFSFCFRFQDGCGSIVADYMASSNAFFVIYIYIYIYIIVINIFVINIYIYILLIWTILSVTLKQTILGNSWTTEGSDVMIIGFCYCWCKLPYVWALWSRVSPKWWYTWPKYKMVEYKINSLERTCKIYTILHRY